MAFYQGGVDPHVLTNRKSNIYYILDGLLLTTSAVLSFAL